MNEIMAARLQRQLEDGIDPVQIFRELATVPCVTFCEYILYDYLLSVLDRARVGLTTSQRDRLTINFSTSGQMCVSWRGRGGDPRRTILVAHVDTEGFLVRKFDRGANRVLCWHTSAEMPDQDKLGSPVRLILSGSVLRGRILSIAERSRVLTSSDPFDHEVLVEVERKENRQVAKFIKNSYFVGCGQYDIPRWSHTDGVIAATHVDNTAGVSVVMSVLMTIIKNNWRTNLDCVFTTCEEAGFCGIVASILDGADFDAQQDGDVVCIVVDSSSHSSFVSEERLWDDKHYGTIGDAQVTEASLQNPIIRTGDLYNIFDREVTKLLCAAARNLEGGARERHERVSWAGRGRRSLSDDFRSCMRIDRHGNSIGTLSRNKAVVGRLIGGWCEASPLRMQAALRARKGKMPLRLRVGSLGIPIAHYRNSFNHRLQPEKCHENCLRGACQLLGEAVRLAHRWPFGVAPEVEASDNLAALEGSVDRLLQWQEIFSGLSSVTNEWIRDRNCWVK